MTGAKRFLRILSTALVTAGVVVLIDVGLALVWQEPASAAYTWLNQRRAADDLEALEEELGGRTSSHGRLSSRRVSALARRLRGQVATGEGIGRLKIPSIGLDMVMVQGTDTATLRAGPGHYPETPLPGQGGTVGIAGHRTTYRAPFREINELDRGDEVVIEMPYATLTYAFEKQRIVDPSQVGVVRKVDHERAVLTACHPRYSASQRIVVFARLAEVGPPA